MKPLAFLLVEPQFKTCGICSRRGDDIRLSSSGMQKYLHVAELCLRLSVRGTVLLV